jgi:fused signal recognition particle receptor
MFKFLKDKLKGALSSFSKKVEEAAEETPVEESSVEKAQEPAPEPALDVAPAVAPVSGTVESSEETQEVAETESDVTTKLPESLDDASNLHGNDATPEAPKEIPSITIPEKKEGFFSRIKKAFSKKEEEVPEEKKSDLLIDEQKYDEVVVEKQDVQIEGTPLKTVNIHDERAEEELPIVEGMFEPIEPKVEKPKKKEYNREEFTKDKIEKRIKEDVGIALEVPKPSKLPGKKAQEVKPVNAKPAEQKIIPAQPVVQPEKKGFFSKLREAVTSKKITAQQFDELFWDLEVALLENNVAMEVIEKIKADLKETLVDKPIPRNNVEGTILATLKASLQGLFVAPDIDLLKMTKKPLIICFVGINGSGKTTTIAKIAHLFKQHGKDVVLAAADTFRAAAIDQLQLHADKLGVKLIKHDYGADPAAVAFDAIKHAEATKKDAVLIDTAGRLHSNINLVDEMKKIVRVAKPDVILFIGESITGNDCVEQAKQFNDAVGINGIILSKADIDEKGGAAISVSYVTKKPILYLGVGQEYGDLKKFDPKALLESLGL